MNVMLLKSLRAEQLYNSLPIHHVCFITLCIGPIYQTEMSIHMSVRLVWSKRKGGGTAEGGRKDF